MNENENRSGQGSLLRRQVDKLKEEDEKTGVIKTREWGRGRKDKSALGT